MLKKLWHTCDISLLWSLFLSDNNNFFVLKKEIVLINLKIQIKYYKPTNIKYVLMLKKLWHAF